VSEFRLRPDADEDLKHYASYFAERAGLALSLRFLESADRLFRTLADMPGLGSLFESSDADFRSVRHFPIAGFPNHHAFYLEIEGGIEVLRILNAVQHLPTQIAETLDRNSSAE